MLKILNDKLDLTVFPEQNELSEKLPKDADAGDYVKDFRKSDAPQFKGKSDKKIQKMAIAAYLDSKEEVELDEAMAPHEVKISKTFKTKNPMEIKGIDRLIDMSSIGVVQSMQKQNPKGFKKTIMNLGKMKEEKDLDEALKEETCPICHQDPCVCEKLEEEKGFKVDFGVGREKGMAVYRSKKDAEEFAKRQKRLGNKVKITPGNYKQFDEPREEKESIQENLLIHTNDDRVTGQLVYHLQDLQSRGRSNISDIDTDNVYRHNQNKYVKGRINVEIDGSTSDSKKLIKDLQKKYGSKIKVSLDMGEDNIQEALKINYVLIDTSRNDKVIAMSSDEQGVKDSMRTANLPPLKVKNKSSLKVVKLKRPKGDNMAGKLIGEPLKSWGEEVDMQEASEFEIQVFMLGKILQKHPKFTDEMYDNFMDYAMGGDDFGPALKKSVPRQLYNAIKSHLDKQLKVSQFLSMSNDIQESGHTDVASMKTQVQIAKDALEKMNMELGKLSDEEDLPTWWTNKVATAVGKLDGMADYIDAKSDQGQKMNESNLTEEKVFVVRFEKEGMRFAVPFSDMKRAKDGEKILKKSAGVSNVSVTKDILKPGVSMSKFRTRQEGKIVKESKMGELFLDMQMDAQEMSERDFIKTYSKQGFQAAELKRMHKEFNEEVEIEESLFGAMYDKFVKAAKSMSKDKFVKTYTGKQVMPGQTKSMGKKDLEDIWVDFNEEVDNSLMAQATRVISQTSIKEKIDPADIDDIATADDRKAADKNIIIQLRRAQDMQGKADVTFKDKPSKKEKIDIKVINKALDMFDKMRPNDKAKMQTMIGKSYRDLLKTVQRGRI